LKRILSGIKMRILSIDIGGTNIKYGVFLLDESIGEIELLDSGFFKTPNDFVEVYKYLELSAIGKNFDVVSIGVPGVYDFVNDIVAYSPNLKLLNNLKIKESFNTFFTNSEILVENDGNMAALGEYYFVENSVFQSFILVTLGTGVGGGVIVKGEILSGKTTVGEIGHITINFNGRKCGCGKIGCFEAYCGMSGLIETYNEVSGGSVSKADDIFKKCQNKDVLAKISVDIFAYHLATGLVSLANIFSPECLKIGGGLSFHSNLFFRKTIKYFSKMIFPAFKQNVKLDVATLKNNAGIYGGVALPLLKVYKLDKRFKLKSKKSKF